MNDNHTIKSSFIHLKHHGQVGTITMIRTERFNALDVEMAKDLRKAALQLARDNDIRCVVLLAEGPSFCSGADLRYVKNKGSSHDFTYLQPSTLEIQGSYGQSFKEILEYIHSTISEIRRAPKPFIAAVNGVAAAGGFGIAMSCDLVFASQSASFEWAYARTGLTGAESSTFFLPRLIGLRKAFELIFLNPRLDAQKAFELGLVTRVLPTLNFNKAVLDIAQELANGPTNAFATAKRLLNKASGMERLDPHLDRELRNLVQAADNPDFATGLNAFFAKEKPNFSGDTNA